MAVSNLSLPRFPPFDVHFDGNVGPRWKKWLARFDRLLVGTNITEAKQQRALLLHYAGPDVDEIFDTLSDTGEAKDYQKAVDALNTYFIPQVNTAYEEYNFRQAKQQHGETIDAYHTRLRQLAQTCEFANVDKEVKTQIIIGCSSQRLRRRALRDNPNLKDLLAAGRAQERSEAQAESVEKGESTVNSLRHEQNKTKHFHKPQHQKPKSSYPPDNTRNRQKSSGPTTQSTCRNCGGSFPHSRECPAKGKECRACGKTGHYAKVCRSHPKRQHVRHLTETDESLTDEAEYVFTVQTHGSPKNPPLCEVCIENEPVQAIVDSGASVNILDEPTYKKINKRYKNILTKPQSKIYAYGSNVQLPLLGMITANIRFRSAEINTKFYVTKGRSGNLLSCHTAEKLGLLKIIVNTATDAPNLPPEEEFQDLFGGIGKIKDKQIKLHIDPEVKPKQQPHRRIPFHIRQDVEKELQRLQDLDIIETVDGPTPWVSPIVVVPKKSGEIRLCVDMREANHAIKREKHLMPTIDELITDLNGATVFSTLDLASGYHQLELDPESRHITTFTTHIGLRRYKRLMFGINAAPEIFQNAIAELLTGLPGCKNISDDIIVYGCDEEEHDENLHRVLTRLRENNARLNREKCTFRQSEVIFYGHSFSANGIKAAPQKIQAIQNMQPPKNQGEVKSLLGMAQYVSRFIPNYATITAPLRALTHQNSKWKWEEAEENSLRKLQDELTSNRVMSYFDPTKPTEVIVDASPTGLGAILTQEEKIISYGSRALSDVETRYSQTEREMLAVVWATEHYHLYLYGAQFTVITDHKPLLGIFKSHKPASPRIDRWKLRLMPYNCEVMYKPGKDAENPADFISRHPDESTPLPDNIAENYVNYLCNNIVPKAMTLSDVKNATKDDHGLQQVSRAIETNRWFIPEVKQYRKVKDELSICDGVILRGRRLVLPQSLQSQAVELAHAGHQGIVKTKRLLREKVWFPSIDRMVESRIKNCVPCQAATQGTTPSPEPLNMTPLPKAPWKEVAVDFVGPFPSGELLLVAIDEYSRFPEVEILHSTTAKAVIPKLDSIFSRQGIPDVVKSDNGPPFNSCEFANFASFLGFHHRKVTPYWPKANGEVERFMRTLGKAIRTANVEQKNWKQAMHVFLRQYRATPHTTTNLSPSEALNNRQLKIPLPQLTEVPESHVDKSIRTNDAEKKLKMKEYADQKQHSKVSEIKVGDTVLIRQPKVNKLTTPFNPKPFVVTTRKGSMVTVKRGSKKITRNISFFKKIVKTAVPETDDDDDDVVLSEQHGSELAVEPPGLRRSQRPRRQPTRLGY